MAAWGQQHERRGELQMGNPDPINAWHRPEGRGHMTGVRKHSATVQISRDMALDYGLVQPTPAERAEREAWHAEYEQRKRAAAEALPMFVAALAAVTDTVARVALDLHSRDGRGDCSGCDFGGYEAEPPEWPCRTTTTIAATLGIDVPPDLDMVTIADNG